MADGEAAVAPAKKSDLGVRTLSAIAMVLVAGVTLWLGGWWWAGFVALVSMGVLWEWRGLARGFTKTVAALAMWNVAGFIYIVTAALVLVWLRTQPDGDLFVLTVAGSVVATDIGAYFFGRTIGGPKIAPRISPSKTWAGLLGGVVGASLVVALSNSCIVEYPVSRLDHWLICEGTLLHTLANDPLRALPIFFSGIIVAVLAQTGDFFESWMKRRAGVKDSGRLLPGHGGLFDRVDGLLAVCFAIGLFILVAQAFP